MDIEKKKKWDLRFLNLCDHISSWSRDPSTKTGCVIVDNQNRVISIGYNGFPRGVEDKPEWYADRESKYYLVCHADRNALDNAPCDVTGMTMYLTGHPCSECQKSIIQKGIKKVIWYKSDPAFEARWKVSKELLELAGVGWEEYERPSDSWADHIAKHDIINGKIQLNLHSSRGVGNLEDKN